MSTESRLDKAGAQAVNPADPTDPNNDTPAPDPVWRYASIMYARGAFTSLAIVLLAGLVAALYYVPAVQPFLKDTGIDMRVLEPLHKTFAAAWVFLGGLAIVMRFMQDEVGRASRGDRLRLRVSVLAMLAAGIAILVTIPMGITSGREYVPFHPAISVLILTGWVAFGWTFLRAVLPGFWKRPVHIMMWTVGVLFFTVTFLEQHYYLLPHIFADPVQDLRVQWKACGTLVGSFNLFVYGAAIYIATRICGDESYGHSRTAWALFGVGLLNSFTNFGHHTYHLPQSSAVHWISFIVSMMEIIILFKVLSDVVRIVGRTMPNPYTTAQAFLAMSKWWTALVLFTSILLSYPPINALFHGTYAVTGHAMGAMIGIDTMVLFGALAFLLAENARRESGSSALIDSSRMRGLVIGTNAAALAFVAGLHVVGGVVGVNRYLGLPAPAWSEAMKPWVFAGAGTVTFVFFAVLVGAWFRQAFRYVPMDPAFMQGILARAYPRRGPQPLPAGAGRIED
jgi:nitric oxide reductase subunit B